mgnify:FL=1
MARLEATVEDGKVTLTAVAPWRGWVNRFMGAGLAVGMCLGAGLGVVPEVQASPQSDSEKIAQLESQIAANRVKADQAKIAYAKTAESFAQATDDLNESEAQAKAASEKAQEARKVADIAKAKLGQLAVAMYRQGNQDFAGLQAVTEEDAFHHEALKQGVANILGSQADSQIQSLSALQNVAAVLEDAADQALAQKQAAASKLSSTEKKERAAAEQALAQLQDTEKQREAIIAELAKTRQVTVEQEQLRQRQVEEQRQIAAAAQAKREEQQRIEKAKAEAAAAQARAVQEAQARAQREAQAAAQAQAHRVEEVHWIRCALARGPQVRK